MIHRVEDLVDLYMRYGRRTYGEGVSQIDHAVQCAGLAEASGAPPPLIVAALLHDIGHLLDPDGADAFEADHESTGAAALATFFGDDVIRPVALHVAAKRYLCAVEPDYFAALSPASQLSLVRQGGAYDPAACVAFGQRPGAQDAVALRRFDDSGKRPGAGTGRRFADYVPLLLAAGRTA